MNPHPVSLLVPSAALPAEGAEFDWPASFQPKGEFKEWLQVFRALCGEASPRFHVRKTDVDLLSDIEAAGVLQWVKLGFSDDDALPQLEASPATTTLDWSTVIGRVTEKMTADHFIATPQEMIRVFLEETRAAVSVAARGFAGEAVPVVSIRIAGDDNVTIVFHGVWQAEVGELKSLKGGLPVRGLGESDPVTLDACLLLNESEVEGRGLVEAVLSVSMLAMVFQDQQKHLPPPLTSPAPITEVVQQPDDELVSEPLEVKSQKLKQPAPVVYPNVIKNAEGCEHKIVVDIEAQRAFVFIDNKLAFETPVSSASKGRHTPRGTFTITEKIRSGKRSTLYKSLMPYWMRLDQSAIGMHTGQLPGYAASHGCLRMPDESARFIFDLVPKGTTVQVVDSIKPKVFEAAPAMVAER